MLERLTGEADTRPILQKAREHLLDPERLTRQVAAVHEPASRVHRLIDELGPEDLPAVAESSWKMAAAGQCGAADGIGTAADTAANTAPQLTDMQLTANK